MTERSLSLFTNQVRSEWVRSQTLVALRWMAICGQIIAVCVAYFVIEIKLNFGQVSIIIGASIVFNLIFGFILPQTQRLTRRSAVLSLMFDLFQLVLLLYFTGGLTNPFSLLLLAPVTISATALTLNATMLLGICAVVATSLLVPFHIPLMYANGDLIALPPILMWGNWAALLIGFIFLSAYARRVTIETFSMSQALAATQMALDREHKLTAIGGVVAAAAHEMGTPLATIKMTAAELQEELSHNKELYEDATLIHEQADRLSGILQDMGSSGKDDLHMHRAPLLTVLEEAAEPHEGRGKEIHFLFFGERSKQAKIKIPNLPRHPEIIHGLRNLIQNAVDFAKSEVWINMEWDEDSIRIFVLDDGIGFPSDFLGRIGDPFLQGQKKVKDPARPEYEGMGLGLFIAKTLLERTGATLNFANAAQSGFRDKHKETDLRNAKGALVSVHWPIARLKSSYSELGQNLPFDL